MKKTLLLLILVVLMLILPAVMYAEGKKAEEEKKKVIGEVFWGLHDSYQQAHQKAADDYCEELGFDFIPMDGQMKPEVQAAAMEDLVARKVDGIICQAYDQATMEVAIAAVQEAGIPVVSFVNVASGKVKYPTMMIEERKGSIAMGELVAQKMMEYHSGIEFRIATISDPSIDWAHDQRTKAFVKGVTNVAPDAEWVFNGGKSNREVAYATAEDILQRHPDVTVMFGYDAENVLGGLAAFEAAGRGKADDKMPLTEVFAGVDGSVPEIIKVANPNSAFKATLALQPKANARKCIDMLIKIWNGELDMYATDKNEAVVSFIVNGWDMSIDEIQHFLKDQWNIEIDLREEIGL
jgi:ABC-type sugar transport system substrate-binding protein